jgi:type III secretion protein C
MSRYQSLIDSLDVEPQMLEIEATIIDINTGKLKELGINWRWQNNDDEVLFGSGREDSDIRLNTGGNITPFGKGGFISFVLGDNAKFIGRINALESKGAAHIVSRPHVITLSNVEAILDTSETFYVRVAGREEVDLYNVSIGTSLRVTPHVFKDNGEAKIKLLVTIEDGQQTDQEVDNIPVVSRSAINTQALINAGESVLIGGLVREVKQDLEDKIPLLGDIPIMGNLFKTNSKQTKRLERLFLISPKLAVQKLKNNDKLSKLISEDLNPDEDNSGKGAREKDESESKPSESWKEILDI